MQKKQTGILGRLTFSWYVLFLLLVSIFFTGSSFSACTYCPGYVYGCYYAAVAGGIQFSHVDKDNFVNPGPGWPNDHFRLRSTSNEPAFSVRGGYIFNTKQLWLPYYSVGLQYTYVSPTKLGGHIFQYSLPDFENYRFFQRIQRQSFLLNAKANVYRYCSFLPFVTAYIGASSIRTYHYRESALVNVTPRVSPGFHSKSRTNFTYIVGFGTDFILTPETTIGLEFNYGYFGKANTGHGQNYVNLTGMNYTDSKLSNILHGTSIALVYTGLIA